MVVGGELVLTVVGGEFVLTVFGPKPVLPDVPTGAELGRLNARFPTTPLIPNTISVIPARTSLNRLVSRRREL
jgi:hypothetical protein